MRINISGNTIILIKENTKLKPYHVSQIYSWGFTKSPGGKSYSITLEDVRDILPTLIEYLENEGLPYSLSSQCKERVLEIRSSIEKLGRIKDLAKNFKEGNICNEEFNEFMSFIELSVPRKLKEHQIKAAYHLYLVENGANFSVPGSGKTTVVLSVYKRLKTQRKVNLIFVIGPPSCFGPWRTEFYLTFKQKPDYIILAGGDKNARKGEYYDTTPDKTELYLTTFQTLLNDQDDVATFLNQDGKNAFLVIDEAHYAKQLGGNWSNAVLRIAKYAKYRCVLTGTPLPRSYTDVFNLFDFLWPYCKPLSEDTKLRIQIQEENNDTDSSKKLLEESIGPLFYRVRKSELQLISPIFNPPILLRMNKYEKIVYEAIENKIRHYCEEDYKRNIELVRRLRNGRIVRLRQCVSYVKLLVTALENYEEILFDADSDLARIIADYDSYEVPSKLEYLKGMIHSFRKNARKVVIWTHFINTIKLITEHLTKEGYYCKSIYGAIPTEKDSVRDEETREKIRNEFVDSNSGLDILIANPAACAESISLHKTCYDAIYYDLSYNCAQYLQSLDRIHRVGGSEINQANYYFLQYDNTIDQDIKQNLDRKAEKMYDLIEEDCCIYSLDMFEDVDEGDVFQRLFGDE